MVWELHALWLIAHQPFTGVLSRFFNAPLAMSQLTAWQAGAGQPNSEQARATLHAVQLPLPVCPLHMWMRCRYCSSRCLHACIHGIWVEAYGSCRLTTTLMPCMLPRMREHTVHGSRWATLWTRRMHSKRF